MDKLKRVSKYTIAEITSHANFLKFRFSDEKKTSFPILNYHSVNHVPHPEGAQICPENFRSQIEYLVNYFDVVDYDHAVKNLIRSENNVENIAVVTFDDGYVDNFEQAYRILSDLKCPAIIFLATKFIEKGIKLVNDRRFGSLEWSQIIEMHNSGLVTFGTHSHSHEIMSSLNDDQLREEIKLSKCILEDKLGVSIKHFAYPNGQLNDFDDRSISLLESSGYVSACSTVWGTRHSPRDIYKLKRVRIDNSDSMKEFILKLDGAYDFIGKIHAIKPLLSKFQP